MNVYTTDSIRNVVLLGHGGCGKTSLVEAMAYVSGLTGRLGKVSDGTTISDYDKEEIKRKFSINTSVVPLIWKDTKINLQYVVAASVEKLYTFLLTEEVFAEFARVVTWLRKHYVEHRFKSLEILETCL